MRRQPAFSTLKHSNEQRKGKIFLRQSVKTKSAMGLLFCLGLAALYVAPKNHKYTTARTKFGVVEFHDSDDLLCHNLQHWRQRLEGALLIRNGAKHWPVLTVPLKSMKGTSQAWGTALVSPNNTFAVFNNSTAMQQQIDEGNGAHLPNRLVNMTLSEFLDHFYGQHGNLFYAQEHYYYQGQAPQEFLLSKYMGSGPLACLAEPPCFEPRTRACDSHFSQVRLRVNAAGAQHALHYDLSATVLIQLQGHKEVILIAPNDLSKLYPYERDHILFRRARIDLSDIDLIRYPLAHGLSPVVVTMSPGDVLAFPAKTSHTTRALSESVSLSARFHTVGNLHASAVVP